MPEQTTPIAETNRFIVLDKYVRAWEAGDSYQSETDLERELVQDLRDQGYEYLPDLNSTDAMLANVRVQLQGLNDVQFTDKEWALKPFSRLMFLYSLNEFAFQILIFLSRLAVAK